MPDPTRVPDRRIVAFAYGTITRSGAIFQRASARLDLIPRLRSHNPGRCPARFGLVPVRSPLLTESLLLSFPPGTEMFQFPGSARAFRDQRSFGSSPGLIAVFHARILLAPRHPPHALSSLTTPIGPPRPVKAAVPIAAGHSGAGRSARGVSRRGGPAPGRLHRSVRVV